MHLGATVHRWLLIVFILLKPKRQERLKLVRETTVFDQNHLKWIIFPLKPVPNVKIQAS